MGKFIFFLSAAMASMSAAAQSVPGFDAAGLVADADTLVASTQLPGDHSSTWDETATRDYYNGDIHLPWRHAMGDYIKNPVGSVAVPMGGKSVIQMHVTGNNFLLRSDGATAFIDSRSAAAERQPTLIVNGSQRYTATRSVALSAAMAGSLGGAATMSDGTMLIAFDEYSPKPGDTAVLRLTSEKSYGAHRLTAYQPDIQPSFPVPGDVPGGTVVRDIRAADFTPSETVHTDGGIVTASWGGDKLTALGKVFKLPPAKQYFLTVVIRLGADWSNQGGKLPGLANTGQGTNTAGVAHMVNGVDCQNAGWGGRAANGCRWSARTGWWGRSGDNVGLQTYFYAQNPNNGWGYVQHFPTPATVGQWFAYVERVQVNTPGQSDGRLTYWLCTQTGCNAQYDRNDIRFRSTDVKDSLISEAWADVYCGGVTCGSSAPWPTSTVSLKRMTVTTGLPDLNIIQSELKAINSTAH